MKSTDTETRPRTSTEPLAQEVATQRQPRRRLVAEVDARHDRYAAAGHDEIDREAAAELQRSLDELDPVRPGADRQERAAAEHRDGEDGRVLTGLNAKRSRAGSPVNGRCSDAPSRRSCKLKTPTASGGMASA